MEKVRAASQSQQQPETATNSTTPRRVPIRELPGIGVDLARLLLPTPRHDANNVSSNQPNPPVHTAAEQGVAHASQPLPHLPRVQAAFGRHDLGSIRTTVGPAPAALQAHAYTVGNRIVFRYDPDVRLVAHEAAHVVQQRGGARVDERRGAYEQHANRVADAVSRGQSAESLLDSVAGGGATPVTAVQLDADERSVGAHMGEAQHSPATTTAPPRADDRWRELARIEEAQLENAKLTTPGVPTLGDIQTLAARLQRDDLTPDGALVAAAHLDARVFAISTERPWVRSLLATRLEMFVELYEGKWYAPAHATPILAAARAFLDAHSAVYVAYATHQTARAVAGMLATPAHMNEPVLTINNVPAVRRAEVTPERIEQIKRDAAIEILLAPALGAAELGKRLEALVGYPVGVLEGAAEAARDLSGAAVDNIKQALSFVGSLLTGTFLKKLLELAEKLWDFITSLPDLARALGPWFAQKWSHASYYGKGELIGEIVGYIALSIAIGALTEGASLEAEGSELKQAAMKLLKIVNKAANPVTFIAPFVKPVARVAAKFPVISHALEATAKVSRVTAPARRWVSELPGKMWRGLGRTGRTSEEMLGNAEGLVDRWEYPWRDGDAAVMDAERVPPSTVTSEVAPPARKTTTPHVANEDGCFVAGTQVWTPGGVLPIEDLRIGRRVFAADLHHGLTGNHAVMQTFESVVSTVIDLYVDGTVVTCTPAHPFWLHKQGWVLAGHLNVGDCIVTSSGRQLFIEATSSRQGTFRVYNITVDGLATYHVSALGILVHNKPMRFDPKRMFDQRKEELYESISELRAKTKQLRVKAQEDLTAIQQLERDVDEIERQVKAAKYIEPTEGIDYPAQFDPLGRPERLEDKALKDAEYLDKKVPVRKTIPADRPALDTETVLGDSEKFSPTGKRYQGRRIYRAPDGRLCYVDNFHNGSTSEIEVFSSSGEHLGTMTPEGIFNGAGKVPGRRLKKDLL